jgi:hypothetical protein
MSSDVTPEAACTAAQRRLRLNNRNEDHYTEGVAIQPGCFVIKVRFCLVATLKELIV